MTWSERLLQRVGPALVSVLIRAIACTLRSSIQDESQFLKNPPPACIIVFWHNRILMMPWFYMSLQKRFKNLRPLSVMISRSKDGSLIASTAAKFGVGALRGSSSKGATGASRQALRALENGEWVGITPDGPRGPVYEVKSGLTSLAQKAGVPVVPVCVHYSCKIQGRSWDKFQIPLPFSKAKWVIGKPISPETAELETCVKNCLGV